MELGQNSGSVSHQNSELAQSNMIKLMLNISHHTHPLKKLLFVSMDMPILDISYKESYNVWCFGLASFT